MGRASRQVPPARAQASRAHAGARPGGDQQVEQEQQASNSNKHQQQASSEAHSKQVNVNAPVAVWSPGSDNGDVDQANQAKTVAASQNNNSTKQGNFQNQEANTAGGGECRDSCGCKDGKGDGGQKVDQSQTGRTATTRARTPKATRRRNRRTSTSRGPRRETKVDPPTGPPGGGWLLGPRVEREVGNVSQSNLAETLALSQNNNETAQGNFQNQEANTAGGGDNRDSCGCEDHKSGDGGQKVDQSQYGSNSNDTSQNAESNATTEQKNINKPGLPERTSRSVLHGLRPVAVASSSRVEREVGQRRASRTSAETLALSQNNNETAQGLQKQGGIDPLTHQ